MRAFSWGSLTSGSALTALWVLLLPYMLANVAGWMMLPYSHDPPILGTGPRRGWTVRWMAFFVRLTAMVVSVIFTLFWFLLLADLVAFQSIADRENHVWLPAAGAVATAVVLLCLFYFTRVRLRSDARFPRPWEDDVDAVGYALLHRGQDDMWDRPGIIVRLRRLHLGAAWGVVALLAALIRSRVPAGWDAGDRRVALLAWAACGLPVVFLALVSLGNGRVRRLNFWIRWFVPLLSLAALGTASYRLWTIDEISSFGNYLPVIRGVSGVVAFGFLAVVVVPSSVGWLKRLRERSPAMSGWNQPALLLAAAAVGATFGAGVAIQFQRWLGGGCIALKASTRTYCDVIVGPAIDWMAISITWAFTAMLLVLMGRFFLAFWRARGKFNRSMVAVRGLTDNPSRVLRLVAVLGILLIAGLSYLAWRGYPNPKEIPGWVAVGSAIALSTPFVLIALWWPWQIRSKRSRFLGVVLVTVGVGLVIVAVVLAVLNNKRYEFLGIPLPPTEFLEMAQIVALVLPMSLLLSRILWGGLWSREARKGPAILWDLGAFWPRWFHPFAPPTYSDRAVKDLTREIENRYHRGVRLLLAPHSQGSIIATAAITGAQTGDDACLAMLSYGSPWSRLYAQAFPTVFCRELLDQLGGRLSDSTGGSFRWRNLYRESDPIGGPIFTNPPGLNGEPPAGVEVPALEDPCNRAHFSYDLENEYKRAVGEMKDLLDRCSANDERRVGPA